MQIMSGNPFQPKGGNTESASSGNSFREAKTVDVILGVAQVPYIEDPNTGTAMFESNKIIEYLNDTYAVK